MACDLAQVTADMKIRHAHFRFLLIFLFAVVGAYSLFDMVQEADFLFKRKYENRDIENLYAEKGNGLLGLLLSVTLFSPLSVPLLKFPPSFFPPETPFTTAFSVLRC